MANEKKYSAQEAAMAVLAKAQELMAKSELFKAEKLRKDGPSIQGGISAAAAQGGVPHTQTATPAGVQSGISAAFGKAESYCEEHAKDISRKGDHKIVQKSECIKCMGKSEHYELYEELAKMEKAENKDAPSDPPKDPSKPIERDHDDFEAKPGESKAPDHREAPQTPPAANPKEQAEGNNPPAGAIPGNGIHKLMYFTGHIHAKKKLKKGIALG